jgi:hypothetical protein
MGCHGALVRHCLGAFLAIAGGLVLIDAVAEDQPSGVSDMQTSSYTYSDDWAIVSAPPPPGPYQSVNVDPRVPGQEDVRTPFMSGFTAPSASDAQLPDDFMGAPPAAGVPSPEAPGADSRQESFGNQPPPGYYRSRGYNQNRPAYGQDYRAPYGYPPSGNPRYGYPSSPWDNPPVQRAEDEVPPPPAYNRMFAPPPPAYRYGPASDQGYRRGTGSQ